MMQSRGICVEGPRGSFPAFLDTINTENGSPSLGPSNTPGYNRQVGLQQKITIATDDLAGIAVGVELVVDGSRCTVWSQPFLENDGLTAIVYIVWSEA